MVERRPPPKRRRRKLLLLLLLLLLWQRPAKPFESMWQLAGLVKAVVIGVAVVELEPHHHHHQQQGGHREQQQQEEQQGWCRYPGSCGSA